MRVLFLLVLFFLIAVLVIASTHGCGYRHRWLENFANITTYEDEEIIRIYNSILLRDPSMDELKKIRKYVEDKKLTFHQLQISLISSDEYQRIAKIQSNTVTPELLRMIAAKEYLNNVIALYKDVFNKKLPSELVLPYNDIYVFVFRRNDNTMRTMFRDVKYPQFEDDVLHTEELNRETLFDMYNSTFVKREDKKPVELPKFSYMVPETSIASDASAWGAKDETTPEGVLPPWRSRAQEEVTYTPYTADDDSLPPNTYPLDVTPPILTSTKPPAPINTRDTSPPSKPPLQGTVIGTDLATSSIMALGSQKEPDYTYSPFVE